MKRNIKMFAIAVLIISMFVLLISCGGKNDESSTAVDEIPVIDVNSSVDELLGDWIDISDKERLVNISKTDEDYVWADNEGEYKATFKEGALTLIVAEEETATVYIDGKTGNLICLYGGQMTKYKR